LQSSTIRSSRAAWFNLASLQESSGELDDAIRSLNRAILIDPQYADAHFNLTGCYERLGQLANAAHHWEQYLRLDNASPWAEQARRSLRQA
jgi:tetratricopeptide (TPR) repeat protein